MELIEETEAEKRQQALPEPEPRYQTSTLPVKKTEHGQAWARLAAAIVAAIILIVLIVLLARWIYHKAHNHATGGTSTTQTRPSASVNNPSSSSASGQSSSNSSANSSGSSNQTGTSNNPTTPGQITNTGPGDVAAIFLASSLAAAGLHYIVSVRRFAKRP